jgi:hypothetical protein
MEFGSGGLLTVTKSKKLDLTLEQMTNEKQNKEMTKQSETGRIIAKIGEMELILHCYFSI